MGPFSTLAQLEEQNVSNDDVGKTAWVAATALWYQAIRPGHGLACWDAIAGAATQGAPGVTGEVFAYQRAFDCDDSDVALAALTAAIDLGSALPINAIVVGVIADNTEDWSDGGAGAFSADVGISGGTADAYTPTALDIDGGVAVLSQTMAIPASGVQLAVTVTGDVNLSTATTGHTVITVLYIVPQTTVVEAP